MEWSTSLLNKNTFQIKFIAPNKFCDPLEVTLGKIPHSSEAEREVGGGCPHPYLFFVCNICLKTVKPRKISVKTAGTCQIFVFALQPSYGAAFPISKRLPSDLQKERFSTPRNLRVESHGWCSDVVGKNGTSRSQRISL